jgi:protein-tyrosine phosphatase
MSVDFSILAVCTGNVHRSALAATLLQGWARWYLPEDLAARVEVRSAGLAAPAGAPMGRRVQAAATALGVDGALHRATVIDDRMIASANLVLVASRRQRDHVLARVPGALRRTFTMREAGRIAAASAEACVPHTVEELTETVADLARRRSLHARGAEDDIVDPQGRGEEVYEVMLTEVVTSMAQLAQRLFGMPRPEVAAYVRAASNPRALLSSTGGRD